MWKNADLGEGVLTRDVHPAPLRPAEKGLPRPAKEQKKVLPRPAKIGKSCGAGRGKVDLNPLKI